MRGWLVGLERVAECTIAAGRLISRELRYHPYRWVPSEYEAAELLLSCSFFDMTRK